MRYMGYDFFAQTAEVLHSSYDCAQKMLNHSANPWGYTPWGRLANASLDIGKRLTAVYDKPAFNIDAIELDGRRIPVYETLVDDKPFCKLLHFGLYDQPRRDKLLLVAPLSGHHSTLMRDTVKTLVAHFDLYITDWVDARDVPLSEGVFSFDDYVSYIIDFMQDMGENYHLFAICQPTVQTLIAAAVVAERGEISPPRSLILAGGPIDVSQNPTAVNRYADQHDLDWFRRYAVMRVPPGYPGAGRKVYPGFMQLTGFVAMNPMDHARKYFNYFLDVASNNEAEARKFRAFYDEYNAVLDLDACFYLETVDRVFHKNALANRTICYQGQPVNFDAITSTALLTIEGEKDDICGLGQTGAAHRLCSGLPDTMRQHYVQPEAGHYGIFSGRRFREGVEPVITAFARRFSTGSVTTAS
jgi:poly(3-hydroxybutyrate) depolymerase